MQQLDMYPTKPAPRAARDDANAPQRQQIQRVSDRIGAAIVEFCRARRGGTFRADELRQFVNRSCGVTAPGSADRILRDLRQKGTVSYVVINRRESLYALLDFAA